MGQVYLVEETGKIHLHTVSRRGIQQDVFAMAVPKSNNMSHHGPHCGCACESQTSIVPLDRLTEFVKKPYVHDWRKHLQHILHQIRHLLSSLHSHIITC